MLLGQITSAINTVLIPCLYFFEFNKNLAVILTKKSFKSFWLTCCWMCTSLPSGRDKRGCQLTLIQNIFQRNKNRFISLVFKTKQQNPIQQPYSFLQFYMNQLSNRSWFVKLVLVYEPISFIKQLFVVFETYGHLPGE